MRRYPAAGRARPSRAAWWLAALLGAALLLGAGAVTLRLRAYWVARYHGAFADLRGAVLIHAPLHGAILRHSNLESANLAGADLGWADMSYADLRRANLTGADLRGAHIFNSSLRGAHLKGVRYDKDTQWPDGLRPQGRGAILAR